jgi:hypothetical protein
MDTHTIRLIGGSLYFQLPRSFKYKFDLKPGDRYHLIPNQDGTVLQFIKAEDEVVPQETTEAAE